MRKAKIVCTIGPASDGPVVLEQLIQSGMNAARLNFSHGTHESHGRAIKVIRDTADRQGVAVAIIQDLQGPRIRVGGDCRKAGVACRPAGAVAYSDAAIRGAAGRQNRQCNGCDTGDPGDLPGADERHSAGGQDTDR